MILPHELDPGDKCHLFIYSGSNKITINSKDKVEYILSIFTKKVTFKAIFSPKYVYSFLVFLVILLIFIITHWKKIFWFFCILWWKIKLWTKWTPTMSILILNWQFKKSKKLDNILVIKNRNFPFFPAILAVKRDGKLGEKRR